MKNLISQNKSFFLPFSILVLICIYFLVFFSKAQIHLFINRYHSPFFDVVFNAITYMGDGIFLPVYLLLMVLFRYRYAFFLLLVFLISGLIVQVLKRYVFPDELRPVAYMKDIAELYLVPGVKQHAHRSFPSGHSATAFGIMVCFILVHKNHYIKLVSLILACLIAYSRMYLSQHFLIDVIVGSAIGTATAIVCYYWTNSWKAKWLDYNILKKHHKINYTLYD